MSNFYHCNGEQRSTQHCQKFDIWHQSSIHGYFPAKRLHLCVVVKWLTACLIIYIWLFITVTRQISLALKRKPQQKIQISWHLHVVTFSRMRQHGQINYEQSFFLWSEESPPFRNPVYWSVSITVATDALKWTCCMEVELDLDPWAPGQFSALTLYITGSATHKTIIRL